MIIRRTYPLYSMIKFFEYRVGEKVVAESDDTLKI